MENGVPSHLQSNKTGNFLPAVREINHKYIVVERRSLWRIILKKQYLSAWRRDSTV